MATRAISWMKKISLVNSLTQATFPSPRDIISPGMRSVISNPVRFNSTSGVYANTRLRFPKQRRNRGEIKGESDNQLCFGKFGLQVLEPAWITSKQILAGQLAIKRTLGGRKSSGERSLLRIFPHKPISLKPAETRMGRGKGATAFWVAGVKPGRILFELDGVPESKAKRAILVAASKLPVRTKFIKS